MFSKVLNNPLAQGYDFFIGNVGMNLYSMGQTTSQVSKNITAHVSSVFDFDLDKNQNSIRTIRLEK